MFWSVLGRGSLYDSSLVKIMSNLNRAAAEAENLLLGRSLVAEAYFKENAEIAVILNDVSTDQDINMNQRLLDNVNMPPLERPDSNSSASSLTSPTASEAAGDSGEFGLSDLSSLKDLVIPEVPAVGEFFDVTVTLAASPSNFTVIAILFISPHSHDHPTFLKSPKHNNFK